MSGKKKQTTTTAATSAGNGLLDAARAAAMRKLVGTGKTPTPATATAALAPTIEPVAAAAPVAPEPATAAPAAPAAAPGNGAKPRAPKKPRNPKPPPIAKDKPLGGLDAAAKVLSEAGVSMRCTDLVDKVIGSGLWSSKGETPAATIYAAIIREIAAKGSAARFVKTGKGEFAARKG